LPRTRANTTRKRPLRVSGDSVALTTSEALLRDNAIGAEAVLGASLTLTGSVVKNNSVNAAAGPGSAVLATGNWWGSLDAAVIAAGTSGGVDYSGFLAYEPVLTTAIATATGGTVFGTRNIGIVLASRNAEEMRLSENSAFPDVFYVPFSPTTSFVLSRAGAKSRYLSSSAVRQRRNLPRLSLRSPT